MTVGAGAGNPVAERVVWLLMIEHGSWGDLPRAYPTQEAAEKALLNFILSADPYRSWSPELRQLVEAVDPCPPEALIDGDDDGLIYSLSRALLVEQTP